MSSAVSLGAFDLVAPLGRGGIAEVWRGIHRAQKTPVAIKIVTGDATRGQAALRDEVRAVAELDHPNVIWVYDHGHVDPVADRATTGRLPAGSQWFAMELAEHGVLRTDCFDWPSARNVLVPLLRALAYAHARGVIHRDVKPGNILFGGARPGLKLSDFGLMYAMGSAVEHQGASGTPAYMAPEQCLGQLRRQGPWTDLYAVGCTAFRLVTGENPYSGTSWASVFSGHVHDPIPPVVPRFEVPAGLAEWVTRLLQKSPTDRYRWAADALNDLLQLDGQADPEPDWKRPDPPRFAPELEGAGLGLFGLRGVPVVGHDTERDQLWTSLSELVANGEPRAIVLRGASGTGKSRLSEWLGRRAHELGVATVLRTVHTPDEGPDQGLPGLVVAALRCQHLDRSGIEAHLEAELGPAVDAEDRDRLSQLMRPTDSDADRSPIGPGERHGLVRRALEAVIDDRPAIVRVDDAQWGLNALRLVRDLVTTADLPILFVLTVRDDGPLRDLEAEALRELSDLDSTTTLEVDLLPPEMQRQFVRRLLTLDPELEAQVCERSGGHAGFAVQLLADWVERGLLEPSRTGYRLATGRIQIPTSEVDLLRSRLGAVLHEAGDTWGYPLELAATLGQVVDGEEWAAVCRVRRVKADPELVAALRAAGLARPIGTMGTWAFRHGALRQVLLQDASMRGRMASHHRACARMLEATSRPGIAARLGVHYVSGGDLENAIEPLRQGALELFTTGEYGLAARLLVQRGQALELLAPDSSDERWGQGWMEWTRLRRAQGRFEEAQNWLAKVLGSARLYGWKAIEVDARIQAAKAAEVGPERARYITIALELANELGDASLIADASHQLAIESAIRGDNKTAIDTLPDIIEGFEARGQKVRAQGAWIALAHIYMQDERYDDVADALARAEPLVQATRARYSRGQIEMMRGEVARQVGRLEDAEQHYMEAWRLNDAMGNVAALLARIHVGIVRAEQGRFDEATPQLEACLRLAERPFYAFAAHLGLVLCSAASPEPSTWRSHMQPVADWDAAGRADADVARMLVLAGEFADDAGHDDRAAEAWRLSANQYRLLGRLGDAQRLEARATLRT